MRIAFIGLGIMGSRMAANLVRTGFDVVVHNRTRDKEAPLAELGASRAASIAEAVRDANVAITMLSTPEVVRETASGRSGLIASMRKGSLWVDSTTVNPSFSRSMAELAHEAGIRFVDAPVAGSKAPAESAQLLFLAGGDDADITEAKPLFDVMGRATLHAGPVGQGSAMKMVFNLLLGETMYAFGEAVALAVALGLDRKTMLDALLGSALAAPFLASKRSMLDVGEIDTQFPLEWTRKDLQLASQSAYEKNLPTPGLNAIKEAYAAAVRDGLGREDLSAIARYLERGK